MILAVAGVVIAFNVSLYLVLATFLKDNKRKGSTVDFPELKGTFGPLPHTMTTYVVLIMTRSKSLNPVLS